MCAVYISAGTVIELERRTQKSISLYRREFRFQNLNGHDKGPLCCKRSITIDCNGYRFLPNLMLDAQAQLLSTLLPHSQPSPTNDWYHGSFGAAVDV